MSTKRGTSNGNVSGNSEDRRRRKAWLVQTYRADVDADLLERIGSARLFGVRIGEGVPACRCYHCGILLTTDTVTVDRIIPGCQGGTYRRDNIRPACQPCQSRIGGKTRG